MMLNIRGLMFNDPLGSHLSTLVFQHRRREANSWGMGTEQHLTVAPQEGS